MATTTPNFGWPVPTSTDLVKDGAVAIEGLGDAIDASLLDLKGGTTNQILAKNSNTDMDFKWVSDATGMTNPMTTTGDTIYSSSGSTPARLGIGSTGQVLTVAGGVPSWATPASGGGVLGSLTITNGADYTTTSTSLVAVSTSNARVTVTTTSTKLIVLLTGWAENATGNSAWSVSVGAGTVYEQMVSNNSYETPNPNASSMHIITGLTANTSYNVDWMYRAISAGTAIIAGGNNTVYPRMVVLAG